MIDILAAKLKKQEATTPGDPVTSGGPAKSVEEVDAMSANDFKNFIIGMSPTEQGKYPEAQRKIWEKRLSTL